MKITDRKDDVVLKRTKILFAYIIQYLFLFSCTMISETIIEYYLEGDFVRHNSYDLLISLTNFSYMLMLYGIGVSIKKSKSFEPHQN